MLCYEYTKETDFELQGIFMLLQKKKNNREELEPGFPCSKQTVKRKKKQCNSKPIKTFSSVQNIVC